MTTTYRSEKFGKKIKSIEGYKSSQITTLTENGKIITDQNNIANLLAEKFAENSNDEKLDIEFLKFKTEIEASEIDLNAIKNNDDPINAEFSLLELKAVLSDSKNTSPGPDDIPNIFLKQLPNKVVNTLLKIYNYVWSHNLFPSLWNQAIVIPIPKPGKDKQDKGNYRPIALTCCMCKIIEKC